MKVTRNTLLFLLSFAADTLASRGFDKWSGAREITTTESSDSTILTGRSSSTFPGPSGFGPIAVLSEGSSSTSQDDYLGKDMGKGRMVTILECSNSSEDEVESRTESNSFEKEEAFRSVIRLGSNKSTRSTVQPWSSVSSEEGMFINQWANPKNELTEFKSDLIKSRSELTELKRDLIKSRSELTEFKRDLAKPRSELTEFKRDLVKPRNELSKSSSRLIESRNEWSKPSNPPAKPRNQPVKSNNQPVKPRNQPVKPRNQLVKPNNQISRPNSQLSKSTSRLSKSTSQLSKSNNQLAKLAIPRHEGCKALHVTRTPMKADRASTLTVPDVNRRESQSPTRRDWDQRASSQLPLNNQGRQLSKSTGIFMTRSPTSIPRVKVVSGKKKISKPAKPAKFSKSSRSAKSAKS